MHTNTSAASSSAPRRRRLKVAAGLAGASVLALAAFGGYQPSVAQLKPDGQTMQMPGRAPLSFADIVDRVKPAVVSISVRNGEDKVARNEPNRNRGGQGGIPGLPDDHPLNEFFKNLPREFGGPRGPGGPGGPRGGRPSMAQGSGFVVSADGYIVTNNHVIDGGGKIQVAFDESRKFDAELVGTDARTDLALLKIKSDTPLSFVKFATRDNRVGDWVVAVGNPFGLGGTVTAGILSAQGRDIGSGPYDYLQIDAAVNRGNSGGPTFNLDGDVIGVNTAIYSPSGGNVGIAFAVPAKTAAAVVEQLKSSGSVSRGWLGVKIQNIDEDIAASLGMSEPKGALINEVTPNGPALASGLRTQDAIVAVNGQPIDDSRDLARKIAEFSPNTTVDVKVLRAGKEQMLKVKLGTFPNSREELAKLDNDTPPKPPANTGFEMGALGLTLAPAASPNASAEGVAIAEVTDNSDAATKGLKSGDLILEVNSQKVANAADVETAVKRAQELGRRAVLLSIKSGDQRRVVAVQLNATTKKG
jgi:serine protease Do